MKYLNTLLALAVAIGLAACGSDSSTTYDSASEPTGSAGPAGSTEGTTMMEPAAMGKPAEAMGKPAEAMKTPARPALGAQIDRGGRDPINTARVCVSVPS